MSQTGINNASTSQSDTRRGFGHSKGLCIVCVTIIVCFCNVSSDLDSACVVQGDDITGSRRGTGDEIDNRTSFVHRRNRCDCVCTKNDIRNISQHKGSCSLGDRQRARCGSRMIGVINGCGDIVGSLGRGTCNHSIVRILVNHVHCQAINRWGGRNDKDRTGISLGCVGQSDCRTHFVDSQRTGRVGDGVVAGGKTCRCCHIASRVRHRPVVANRQTGGDHSRHSRHSCCFYSRAISFISGGYGCHCICRSGFTPYKTGVSQGCGPICRGRGIQTIDSRKVTQIGRQGRGIDGVTGRSVTGITGI